MTNSTRRGPAAGPRPCTAPASGISADRRSARTCSASPRARRPGRPPQRDLLDRARELEILVGDPAGAVRRQLDRHASPGHRQIGMVVRRLGAVADRVDQHQRRRPPVGLVDAPDPAVLVVPAGQLLSAARRSAPRRRSVLFQTSHSSMDREQIEVTSSDVDLRSPSPSRSHHHAAADENRLAGQERRGRRRQEHRGAGDVVGRAPALERRGLGDRRGAALVRGRRRTTSRSSPARAR